MKYSIYKTLQAKLNLEQGQIATLTYEEAKAAMKAVAAYQDMMDMFEGAIHERDEELNS